MSKYIKNSFNSGKIDKKVLFFVGLFLLADIIIVPAIILNKSKSNPLSPLPNPQKEKIKVVQDVSDPDNLSIQKTPQIVIKTKLSVEELKKRIVIRDYQRNPVNLPYDIIDNGDQKTIIIIPGNEFKPGAYMLEIEKISGVNFSQDFDWGVLAINTNKSSYLPGEEAEIYMTVLDDRGLTACSAEVFLTIVTPKGEKYIYDGSGPSIIRSPDCKPKNFTYEPDFKAIFPIPEVEGTYDLILESRINGKTRQSSTMLMVSKKQPFVVSRSAPVRIYPPSTYEASVKVEAPGSTSFSIVDVVPSNFEIKETDAKIKTQGNYKILTWDNQKNGSVVKFKFKAPPTSPEFYLFGPLKLIQEGKIVFEEIVPWQIASDAPSHLIVLSDGPAGSAPAGWTCISCASPQDFYNYFPRGSNVYGTSGGTNTHTHTFTPAINGPTGNSCGSQQGMGGAAGTHAANPHIHPAPAGLSLSASNIPAYRGLKMFKNDAGIPSTIGSSMMLIFDATVPASYTRYTKEDLVYILGLGTTAVGGGNSHGHPFAYTLAANLTPTATGYSGFATTVITTSHTHTMSGTASRILDNNLPPTAYIILGQVTVNTAIPLNSYGMFDSTPTSVGWSVMGAGATFSYQKLFISNLFIAPNVGSSSHTHTTESVLSSNASATSAQNMASAGTVCSNSNYHTYIHTYPSANNIPPYKDVIVAKLIDYGAPVSCYAIKNIATEAMTIYWTDNAAITTDYYEVWRSTNAGAYRFATSAPSGSVSIGDTTTAGNTYIYKIKEVFGAVGTAGTQSSTYCTTVQFDTSRGSIKFEGVKMEGIKINYILKYFNRVIAKAKNLLKYATYAIHF